jgi:hypothetical protein
MKIYAVMTVARQIDGEYVFTIADKAYKSEDKADERAKNLRATYITEEGRMNPIKVTTETGEAICHCEVKAFPLELEE